MLCCGGRAERGAGAAGDGDTIQGPRREVTTGAAPTELALQIDAGPDADDEELAQLALRLRAELDGVDDASVRLARSGTPEPGAKSGEAVEWGTLLVSTVTSGALTAVVRMANSWVSRQRGGAISVRIGADELVLTGASTEDQRRVVEDWLARRADGGLGRG